MILLFEEFNNFSETYAKDIVSYPSDLIGKTYLKKLQITNAKWSGPKIVIDDAILSTLTNLEIINLSGPLTTDDSVYNLPKLKKLFMLSDTLPNKVGMSGLEELQLLRVKQTNIPKAVYSLKNLKKLTLEFDRAQGDVSVKFPEGISKMNNLELLAIDGCDDLVLPTDLLRCKSLKYVVIDSPNKNILDDELKQALIDKGVKIKMRDWDLYHTK